MTVIVSITKFSIVIGSPGTSLSRNQSVITWVSNYRCPIRTFCNWISVIGLTHVMFPSIACALMASLAMFLQFSKLRKSATDVYAQKKFLEDNFNSEICYGYD